MQKWGKKQWILGGLLLGGMAVLIAGIGIATKGNGSDSTNEIPVSASSTPGVNLIDDVTTSGDHLQMKSGSDVIELDVIGANAVRVQVKPDGHTDPDTEVIGNRTFSSVGAKVDISGDPITVTTDRMIVKLNKATRGIAIYDTANKLLVEQSDVLEAIHDNIAIKHGATDALYGVRGYDASETSTKGLLRDGGSRAKGGQQGYAGAPLVWSTAGYGVLVDTIDAVVKNEADLLAITNTSRKSAHYYLMVGSPTDMMSTVANISGKPPLFPKWAVGFTNSEWGIDQKELMQHVNTYREKQIPIDNFTLDFDWKAWSEDHYGEFRWNETKFPDGDSGKLKQQLDAKGIKLTGIMKPRIHVDTEQGRYATEHNFWWPNKKDYADYFSFKKVNDLNFANPDARKWYFDAVKHSFDTGIAGWWNDEADEGYTTMQFINMQKALYEGQRGYSDKRVWSINRNFYLGAQKYAYGLWSGDIQSGFTSMANQRERMLSAITVGQTKWGMDTGGFNGTPQPDNYARWMQFSAFTPIFRVHGANDNQRQPWFYGDKAEAAAKAAIQLRYKLVPYIYAYERRANETGIGLVKPLLFDYPQDPKVANAIDAWMFGDWLLVSPVVAPEDATKSIYLPQGTWIDYASGTVYQGGQSITHTVDLENWSDIPLFIKKGAIIPSQEVLNFIGEKKVETVNVDVFPDAVKTSFPYYDDDGATYQYEQGKYFKQQLTAEEKDGRAEFQTTAQEGTFTPDLKYYLVSMHGRAGKAVADNGAALQRADSLEALVKQEGEGWVTGKDKYGDVTYVKIRSGAAKRVVVE